MGFVLLALGIAFLVVGAVFFLRLKRMVFAPFRATGDISRDPDVADPRGMISTEGKVVSDAPALAPCSGEACLYYEVKVDRHWKRGRSSPDVGKNGKKADTGLTQIMSRKGGVLFELDDGSGPVSVDTRSCEAVLANLRPSYDERIPIGTNPPSELVFGQMRVARPSDAARDRTIAFTVVERILPAAGILYACGKLANGAISSPGWTPLVLSSKGRRAFLVGTRSKAALGLVSGALLTAGSIPTLLLGWPPGGARLHAQSGLDPSSVPATSATPTPTPPPPVAPPPRPAWFPPPPSPPGPPARKEPAPTKPGLGKKK
jgi:hypothetical protein